MVDVVVEMVEVVVEVVEVVVVVEEVMEVPPPAGGPGPQPGQEARGGHLARGLTYLLWGFFCPFSPPYTA